MYSNDTIVDFLKSLEKSRVIVKGSHKNQSVVDNVNELVSLSEKEFEQYKTYATYLMFYTEFHNWYETYPKRKAE